MDITNFAVNEGAGNSATQDSSSNVFTSNAGIILPQSTIASSSSASLSSPSASSQNFPVIPNSSDQFQKRRSSSRSIKRKKFDDEVVESSLVKTTRTRPSPSTSFPSLPSSSSTYPIAPTPAQSSLPATVTSSEQYQLETSPAPTTERKKPKPSSSRRVKKTKNPVPYSTKDIGRWKPADDLALILAVLQANDLGDVYRGVKFSCRFTLHEIHERWYALLYNPTISKVACNAMKQLHPDVVAQIKAKALFSVKEENILGTVPSTAQPTLEVFEELLNKHPDVFLPVRTAKVLLFHWSLMKHYSLLPDQTINQKLNAFDWFSSFSDVEDCIDDKELNAPRDEDLDREMRISSRSLKQEIRRLENELPKWQVLVDGITGVSPPDFDNQTWAVLKGRFVRYLMRSKEITIGRSASNNSVDIDLSLEGPAKRISRKQGILRMESNGDFALVNEGKRCFYIDGKPVLCGSKAKLSNNSVLEISGLRFIFLVNQDLINNLRAKVGKGVC